MYPRQNRRDRGSFGIPATLQALLIAKIQGDGEENVPHLGQIIHRFPLHDLDLFPILYYLAHVAAWDPYNLRDVRVARVSGVGSVLRRSCTFFVNFSQRYPGIYQAISNHQQLQLHTYIHTYLVYYSYSSSCSGSWVTFPISSSICCSSGNAGMRECGFRTRNEDLFEDSSFSNLP